MAPMTEDGPSHLTRTPLKAETARWARWPAQQPTWDCPEGEDVAVTLTFDVRRRGRDLEPLLRTPPADSETDAGRTA
jgi:hypothetical protein